MDGNGLLTRALGLIFGVSQVDAVGHVSLHSTGEHWQLIYFKFVDARGPRAIHVGMPGKHVENVSESICGMQTGWWISAARYDHRGTISH